MYGTGSRSNGTALEIVGRFFYIINPMKAMHKDISDVPDYVVDAIPYFAAAILLEYIIGVLKGLPSPKVFYVVNNVQGGLIQQTVEKIIIGIPIQLMLYCWIYERYCIYELPWDSAWTWYITFLGVDFWYYWLHRAGHEVNIVWAAHQMHHSSEDMNLTTALRQSALQKYATMVFNLPMAFFIPPSIFFIHVQFNLVYQFWIHTEIVRSIGPLEYILNTPSHHRVHHGRNPYCIDKNYGGTLIIWDRLFNTFAAEDELVAYGLVHVQETANPIKLQVDHYIELFKRCWRMKGLSDKLSVLFRGPGWLSESEKAGLTEDEMKLPEVESPAIYREVTAFKMEDRFETFYVGIHFLVTNLVFQEFFARRMSMSVIEVYGLLMFMFWSVTSSGYILENRWFWYHIELIRCICVVGVDAYLSLYGFPNPVLLVIFVYIVRVIYIMSIMVLAYYIMKPPNDKKKVA